MCSPRLWHRQKILICRSNSDSGGTGADKGRLWMGKDKGTVTTPDLVILSLLAERPMHGYEVNAELERRQARDWVAISRPQIYYSLEKLVRQRLLAESADTGVVLGADRRVLRTSAKGRTVLARELERDSWTNQG